MDYLFILTWLHVVGATVLLGTGIGIAFFMVMAARTRDVRLIAHTSAVVVRADLVVVGAAAITQPVLGILLAWESGWSLGEPWILWALGLYVLLAVFWLPVVWIQRQIRDLAREAVEVGEALPPRFYQLYRWWSFLLAPAFITMLMIIWLMIVRPVSTGL